MPDSARSIGVALATLLVVGTGVAAAAPGGPGPAIHGSGRASPASGPHAAALHDVLAGEVAVRAPVRRPTPLALPAVPPPATARVYGYQAYWAADLDAVPWDALTDLALFAAEATGSGTLTNTSRWSEAARALALAEPYGVKVHLCVIQFTPSVLSELLGSATARAALVDALAAEVARTGAHGVNVDFEGVPASRRADMVSFTAALAARVPEVVLATPAVDWSNAWDYAALTDHADLFIMGYGYHWSGGSPGPVDPLYGRAPWGEKSLDWSIADYLDAGADPERVILGLPLYGIAWPTPNGSVPGTSTGTGRSVFYAEANGIAATSGPRFDAPSRTPWTFTGSEQLWYSNAASVLERTDAALDAGLAGVGFWALHYDDNDPALWDGLRARTRPGPPDEEPVEDDEDDEIAGDEPVANAGRPFLARPGDTVILDGSASDAGGLGALTYAWTQVAGPEAPLDAADIAKPRFVVPDSGTYVYELVVTAGGVDSQPVRSYVVVPDPSLGRAAGCATVGGPGGRAVVGEAGGAAGGGAEGLGFAALLSLSAAFVQARRSGATAARRGRSAT